MGNDLVLIPFYLDWKFWSFLTAFLALILSQLPPLRSLFGKAKLELEAYRRIYITHKVGNPNAQMHLAYRNIGGREIKVRGIELELKNSKGDSFLLPAANYVRSPKDNDLTLFTPFKLKQGEEWAYLVNFFNDFSRHEDRDYRNMESNLRQDIYKKRDALLDKNHLVEADNETLFPVLNFFNSKFIWHHDEYEIVVKTISSPPNAIVNKKYRITIFESESKELKDHCVDYKYGFGVFLEPRKNPGLSIPLVSEDK